jgi:intracellular sulfur oxidation DsrE/DsrF family protein
MMPNLVSSAELSDEDALEGVEVGKVVWDVLVSRPDRLLFYLKLIDETYDDLIRQNIEPDMVFIFHGRALNLIKTEPVEFLAKDRQAHQEALALIKDLNARPGVRMEACSISARMQGIENDKIISDVKVVGNTYVSLIGYQSKGYSVIPAH